MNDLVLPALRRLAGSVFDLRERLRVVLAGELATAVSNAVRDVVAAGLRGDARLPPDPSRPRWADPDPWGDDPDPHDPYPAAGRPGPVGPGPNLPAVVPSAVTAAVVLVRWWLRRRGTLAGAATVGLAAAVAGVAGGPLARIGLAIVTGTAELFAVADALGRAANRYDAA